MQQVSASGRCTVSVWGAIAVQGLGPLHRIGGSLNAEGYIQILENKLIPLVLDRPFPDGFFFLQHYRSPVHKPKVVNNFLDARGIRQLLWPPAGADINIIESIWGLMKRNLSRRFLPDSSSNTLRLALQDEWESLKQRPDLLLSLYEYLSLRMQEVIAKRGGFSKN